MSHPIDEQFRVLLREGQFERAHLVVDKLLDMCAANVQARPVDNSIETHPTNKADNMIVYLPIEIKDRELEGKALLAKRLVGVGFDVVIGQSWAISAQGYKNLPPGIIVFKTLNEIDAHNMGLARHQGHVIYAMDEEAFSRPNTMDAHVINATQRAMDRADWVLAQSHTHADILQNLFAETNKVYVTGNPRVEVHLNKRLKNPKSHNLVCGMSGAINNTRGIYITISATAAQLFKDKHRDTAIRILREACHREVEVFPEVVESIMSNKDVVFRPHPAESTDFWRDWLETGDADDPLIRDTGPAADLMVDAMKVCHVAECGTGIEAELMGVRRESLGGEQEPVDPSLISMGRNAAQEIAEFILFNSVNVQVENHRQSFVQALQVNKSGFIPTAFHKRKFPHTDKGEIAYLTGFDQSKIVDVEPNVWYLEAKVVNS